MSYHTYILRSLQTGRFYYGHCSNLQERLKRHNQGKVKSTKGWLPFEIFYSEEYQTKTEAAKREYFFKSINGYKFLRENNIIPQ